MKKRILICSPLPGERFKEITSSNQFEVKVIGKGESIKGNAQTFDPHGMITLLSQNIDKEVIDSAPNLQIIANYAVGFNNIDINYAASKGISVTNTPGVLTDATADIAFLLMLMVMRRGGEAFNYTLNGYFSGWEPALFLGRDLKHKKLGLIGYGRIAEAVAKRARGFDMEIFYNKRSRLSKDKEQELGLSFMEKEEIYKTCDVISLHLPYTPEVHHIISQKEFSMMKKECVLINTARGQLINEKELADALENRTILGAGLDVFEFEPLIENRLRQLPNAVILPHVGSATMETRSEMAKMVIDDTVLVLEGKKPLNKVI